MPDDQPECCAPDDHGGTACACPNPKHAGDPLHPLAVSERD